MMTSAVTRSIAAFDEGAEMAVASRDTSVMGGAASTISTSCEAEKPSQYFPSDVVSLGSENMFDFLDSEDMEKLSRAIDARCRELNIRPESIEAEMVASQLLGVFRSGVTDEAELTTRPIAMEIAQRQG
ncbi:hypothetical protein OIU34_26530 [Pararhizobium sp. BT-229]|uniref:hypothetical protein n=1 Tax=Pararhizobium sp. BT-229 TaxID=2986923 RepID=UPI0021F6C066|nr:hypothetical protein [Pararhizobium sp. BT-229]MCV9965439.1 hypothetical protein [Pararhizobium sp. BT-229]